MRSRYRMSSTLEPVLAAVFMQGAGRPGEKRDAGSSLSAGRTQLATRNPRAKADHRERT